MRRKKIDLPDGTAMRRNRRIEGSAENAVTVINATKKKSTIHAIAKNEANPRKEAVRGNDEKVMTTIIRGRKRKNEENIARE